jgi:sulfatase maturation enzyme AslB (radical SAM superfamily)
MSSKYFPIDTKTSCRSKWSWSTLYLNQGTTASCHRASISDIPEKFEDFHNTPVKVKDRSVMLQSLWPGNGCEYCRDIEHSGGISDRMFQNQIPDVYPKELDQNTALTAIHPVVLEVFFSNTCNLSCVYCTAKVSSSIQAENKKFGGAILPELNFEYVDNRYRELAPKFWSWFETNSRSLHRLQILGGEPFLQDDVLKLIDYFDQHPHPNLEFNLVTNLILPTKVIQPVLEKLRDLKNQNKLKRIDIQVSVDCWGPSQEYIRHGFKSDTFERNIELLIDMAVFRIGLLSTITSLSISHMPALAQKYNQWCEKQKIFWYMHLVLPNNQSVFDPTMFDYSVFDLHLKSVYNLLPKETWDDKTTLESFDGIVSKLKNNCNNDISRQHNLLKYLDVNDDRRKTNWEVLFPWLTEYKKYVV